MKVQLVILLTLVFLVVNAQIRLPLKKAYFLTTTSQPVPAERNNGFLAEDSEDIALDTVDNTYYAADIIIGSENETFSVVLDTATPVIWVTAVDRETNETHHFNCNKTLDCEVDHFLFPLWRENDTTIRGSIIDDTVVLNDREVSDVKMVLLNQNISLVDFPTDGILGLGLRKEIVGIPIGFVPIFDKLQEQGLIQNRSFAIFLAINDTNATEDPASEDGEASRSPGVTDGSDIIFGGFDPNHMTTDDFSYYDLSEKDDWRIDIEKVRFGSHDFDSARELLFDSRASAISVPKEDFAQLLLFAKSFDLSCDKESEGELQVIKCDSCSLLNWPDLAFIFEKGDNQVYTIHGKQYIYEKDDACIIAISEGEDYWTVGHQFMQNYYTMFDEDNMRIGLAPAAQS